MDREALNKEIEALKQMYLLELPDQLNTIKVQAVQLDKSWDQKLAKEIVKEVHVLSGAAGSFGFPELSTLAREVERELKPLLQTEMQTSIPINLGKKIKQIYQYLDKHE
ncbi:MAG: Hpt domain-containing protein [Oleiphilus sp.]